MAYRSNLTLAEVRQIADELKARSTNGDIILPILCPVIEADVRRIFAGRIQRMDAVTLPVSFTQFRELDRG